MKARAHPRFSPPAAPEPEPVYMPSGCVLYIDGSDHFKDGGIIIDKSGHGNHGTVSGCVRDVGPSGAAIRFDGNDDYINCGHDSSLNFKDFSIAVWHKPTVDANCIDYIIAKFVDADDEREWFLLIKDTADTTEWSLAVCKNGTISSLKYDPTRDRSAVTDRWWHCVTTYRDLGDGLSQARFYINGVEETKRLGVALIDNAVAPIMATASDVIIGFAGVTDTTSIDGLIGSIMLFNRALSEEEAKRLFQAEAAKYGVMKEP